MSYEGLRHPQRRTRSRQPLKMHILRRMPTEGRVDQHGETEELHQSREEERSVHFHSGVDWIDASSDDREEGDGCAQGEAEVY